VKKSGLRLVTAMSTPEENVTLTFLFLLFLLLLVSALVVMIFVFFVLFVIIIVLQVVLMFLEKTLGVEVTAKQKGILG